MSQPRGQAHGPLFSTLIGAAEAAAHIGEPGWVFVDTRFVLGKPDAGHESYREGHTPGAVYANLETDLSGPVLPGRSGRHPLPDRAALEATFGRLGISKDIQVVAYDESTGAMAAARLWWLLLWAGHDSVAVLDGGFKAWRTAGLPVTAGDEQPAAAHFAGRFRPEMVADAVEVLDAVRGGGRLLLDARTADRYRGENETIDPVAGHIPGAISLPYPQNLEETGLFKRPAGLRERFAAAGDDLDGAITYCGSGVTAAHNVLAAAHAELALPKLYAGSWSEWITDPERPVERRG